MDKLIYFKTMAILLACLTLALSANAYSFEKDGIYYNVSGTSATVTYKDVNYNSYSGTVIIPATVTNAGTTYNVRTIGMSAFQNCTNLRRVVIPNSVQYLMNYAFQNCTGLTNITLPASVYTIYNSVFEGCTGLKSVICLNPNARPCYTNNFSTTTYSYAKLIVPQGSLNAYQTASDAWGNFSNIEEISCDFVEDAIFYNVLNNNTVEVADVVRNTEAYSGNIVIPQTVTHSGTTYTVTAVGDGAFYYGHQLYTLELPPTVNSIATYAFYECTNLQSVIIPDGVKYIYYNTFAHCSALRSVFIPASVTWIAENAFYGCYQITSITCKATTPPMCVDSSCFPTQVYNSATLNVPATSLSQYQSESVWSNFYNIVGQYYDFVDNGIYYNITGSNTAEVTYRDANYNSYSGTVNIPQTVIHDGATYTVTAIGRSAFRQCSNLTAVNIPATVRSIGHASFYNCSALNSLNLPVGLQTIEDQALRETGLTQITIPNTVTSIGYAAFYHNQNLTSISIPNSVTSMGQLCFQNCSNLTSATIGSGITVIPAQCFTLCESLSSVNLPSTVKTLRNHAFYGTGFTSFVVPEGVDSIGQSVFGQCNQLESISFPASVQDIGYYVLEICPALAQITVADANPNYCAVGNVLYDKQQTRLIRYAPQKPDIFVSAALNVTSIEMGAFENAANAYYILIGPNVTHIDNSAFNYCPSLRAFSIYNNPNYLVEDGVLYTHVDGVPQSLFKYPEGRQDKHYSVLNGVDTIKSDSFFSSSLLESVYIPQGVKEIEAGAFLYSGVKRVVVDEGLQEIQPYTFQECEQLQSVYLPSTLTLIGQQAFGYDYHLADLNFAGSAPPTIDTYAFFATGYDVEDPVAIYVPAGTGSAYSDHDWNSMYFDFAVNETEPLAVGATFTVDSLNYATTDVALNAKVSGVTSKNIADPGIPPKVAYHGNLCTVTRLADHALAYCTKMERAEVPYTVRQIDDYCFYGSAARDRLVLHEGLEQIGLYAFSHMSNLSSVVIPASVDSLSGSVFTYNPSMTSIDVAEENSKYVSQDGVLFSLDKKRLIAFAQGRIADYVVPEGTQVIGKESFRGTSKLTSVTMPNSIKQIDGYAFFDCTKLTSVEVPKGVTTISSYAFGGCTRLASVDLPSTLTKLDFSVFYNNTQLSQLTVRATTPPECVVYMAPHSGVVSEPFMEAHYTTVNLVVPTGCAQAYRQADVWKKFTNISESSSLIEYIRGDVNDDGVISMTDLTVLINYLLTDDASSINTLAADTNEDGNISLEDLTVLINYLLTDEWPAPKDIDMWYLWGNFFGSNIWGYETGDAALGVSVLPMYPDGEFNSQGKGTLTWSGHIPRGYFTILHEPGNTDEGWGVDNQGNYVVSSLDDPDFSTFLLDDGYYTITLNTKTMTLRIEPYLSTVYTFQFIAMPGYFNGWVNTENVMTPVNTGSLAVENHDWYVDELTLTSDGEMKFCADGDWYFNWGANMFPYGQGVFSGMNVPVKAGTYKVFFNDMSCHYNFIAM